MRLRGVSAFSIGIALLALVGLAAPVFAAGMYDYCQIPPYVNQLTPPDVMILMDSSLSMLNFAYWDNNDSPPNACNDISRPCDGYEEWGAYPGYKYYGYFNADRWYVYSANVFVDAGPKLNANGTPATRPANSWDGNFLNWLTMRRVDVMRKVLTGGRPSADKLTGEIADNVDRGIYKQHGNAATVSPYSGTKQFTFRTGGAGTSSFDVVVGGITYNYSVTVQVPLPVEGVLQTVVREKARLGLAFFNPGDDGANVRVPISGGSLSSTINEINLSQPNSNTPIGESLWTLAGYFARVASIPSVGSPGPRYNPPDYGVNANDDPMNYGSGGSPRYPYCAKSYILILTDGEPCADGNLPTAPVNLANYAGSVSDPYNCVNDNCLSAPRIDKNGVSSPFPSKLLPICSAGGNTAGLEDVALWAHTTDLRSATMGFNAMPGTQNLNIYVVSLFGKGSTLLRYAAINGGFEDGNGNNLPDDQDEWDKNHDGEPDNFNEANDGQEIENAVKGAISTMLKRASSGTAASVLASGEGSGANLVQAVFYPRRRFGNDIAWWSGVLKNVWYYIDPFLVGASIREETVTDGVLDLRNDYIAQFYFDNTSQTTRVKRTRDANGDGSVLTYVDNVAFEDMSNLWESGTLLYYRTPASRTIYTHVDNANLIAFDNSAASVAALTPYLNLGVGYASYVPYVINYIRGQDFYIDLMNNVTKTAGPDGENDVRSRTVGTDNNVWKLGDIIQSTPRIAGKVPLNTYDKIYSDPTYRAFVTDNAYLNRGMVFTGANDGMLHAFKMGKLETPLNPSLYNTAFQKAKLTNLANPPPLGNESWAFIPRNALPYLWYLADPDYCHLYYVDLAPYVFDASIGSTPHSDQSAQVRTQASWRTVLIGGMRTGGACRDRAGTCNSTTDGMADCVKTPAAGIGYSSYFALDVTNPESPSLLWEFANRDLGFATSGPAIVRIHADNTITGVKDPNLNGKWFAVFASGPTGPIDNTATQFMGRSDQDLSLFAVNVKTGAVWKIPTGIANAFGGSLINTAADFDLDYQDEAVYLGFTAKDATLTPPTWTKGGVLRLHTNQDSNPANWRVSTLINNIGPVTSAPARLQNRYFGLNWIYFGEGRYFYARENSTGGVDLDDPGGTASYPGRWLYGIKDPCFTGNSLTAAASCTHVVNAAADNVVDVTNPPFPQESTMNCIPGNVGCSNYGWRIRLDNAVLTPAPANGNERVITDSLATTSSGLVFFTTFKPYMEPCAIGGRSYLWVVRYSTGGAPASTLLKGKALVQVSTASVEEINLSSAFGEKGGRRSGAIEGVPPIAQGLSILSPPPPVKKLLHMQEK